MLRKGGGLSIVGSPDEQLCIPFHCPSQASTLIVSSVSRILARSEAKDWGLTGLAEPVGYPQASQCLGIRGQAAARTAYKAHCRAEGVLIGLHKTRGAYSAFLGGLVMAYLAVR